MEIEHKTFEAEVKAADDENLILDHFISTEAKDRTGDIMRAAGMKIVGRPVVLFQHGRGHLGTEPIARPLSIGVGRSNGKKGIIARTQFYPDETGQRLYQKARDGWAPNWSVGYRVEEAKDMMENGRYNGREILKWELLEYSLVAVPANPEAQSLPAKKEAEGLSGVLFKMLGEDVLGRIGSAITALPVPEAKDLLGSLPGGILEPEEGKDAGHVRIFLGPKPEEFMKEEEAKEEENGGFDVTDEWLEKSEEWNHEEKPPPTEEGGTESGDGEKDGDTKTTGDEVKELKQTVKELTDKVNALAEAFAGSPGPEGEEKEDGTGDPENPPEEKRPVRLVVVDGKDGKETEENQKSVIVELARQAIQNETVAQIRKMCGKVD